MEVGIFEGHSQVETGQTINNGLIDYVYGRIQRRPSGWPVVDMQRYAGRSQLWTMVGECNNEAVY